MHVRENGDSVGMIDYWRMSECERKILARLLICEMGVTESVDMVFFSKEAVSMWTKKAQFALSVTCIVFYGSNHSICPCAVVVRSRDISAVYMVPVL